MHLLRLILKGPAKEEATAPPGRDRSTTLVDVVVKLFTPLSLKHSPKPSAACNVASAYDISIIFTASDGDITNGGEQLQVEIEQQGAEEVGGNKEPVFLGMFFARKGKKKETQGREAYFSPKPNICFQSSKAGQRFCKASVSRKSSSTLKPMAVQHISLFWRGEVEEVYLILIGSRVPFIFKH